MVNRRIIQNTIGYIEDNLKAEITMEELSEMSGFSLYYYCRLFHGIVGMSVNQYILRRKLLHAIYEISIGNKMIDVALAYGFETYAGFYKAFVREFGYTPAKYLQLHNKRKPYKFDVTREKTAMMSHKKLAEVLVNWGLEKEHISDVFYGETGNVSDSAWYVGEEYVLKRVVDLDKAKKHMEITKAMQGEELLVAAPVKTKQVEEYWTEADSYFYVTKRIEGNPVSVKALYEESGNEIARKIGEAIGHLDMALLNVEASVDDVNMLETVINWALPTLKEKMEISEEVIYGYETALNGIYPKLQKQIIHRDPNPSNIIVTEEKWGFVDFELSERNTRVFDPCYAATAILSESFEEGNEEKMQKWLGIYRNILQGYDKVAVLTEEEKSIIPYVVLSNQLIATAWFSESEKYQELYRINRNMTSWIVDHFAELASN